MKYDPITGVILGILYGVPAYFGACAVRWLVLKPMNRSTPCPNN